MKNQVYMYKKSAIRQIGAHTFESIMRYLVKVYRKRKKSFLKLK